MEITIFAKKRLNKEGKTFVTYLTTLTKKNGEKITASVKFRDTCTMPKPEDCPMNIIVDKQDANLSHKTYTNHNTGEVSLGHTLWVSNWNEGSAYIDTSLDDFE